MGFKLGRVYVLEFEGVPDMDGAVVRLRSPSIDTLDALLEMNNREQWETMLKHLIDWNFEDAEGKPIPQTIEGVTQNMEPQVPIVIMRHWYRAARGITAPLENPSSAGTQQPEEENVAPLIPMETQ